MEFKSETTMKQNINRFINYSLKILDLKYFEQ